jgi:hypothetical protein
MVKKKRGTIANLRFMKFSGNELLVEKAVGRFERAHPKP